MDLNPSSEAIARALLAGEGEAAARLLESVLNDPDSLRAGEKSRQGNPTLVATKVIGGETFRAVWEVLSGKRNRSLSLTSLVIKTAK